jgi:hypothetical protein
MTTFNPDVLVAGLQKVEEAQGSTFDLWHPAFNKVIMAGGKPKTLSQLYCEFGLVPVSPESITTILHGTEPIKSGRRQGSVKGNTYATRVIYSYDVPAKDLADISSAEDLVGIIKKYPLRAKLGFIESLVKQFVMGGVADLPGFLTLNGDQTYAPNGATRNGVFSFVPKASQTGSVFGVTRNSITGWHNQYRSINGYNAQGRRQLRRAFHDVAEQGQQMFGKVNVILSDRIGYDNYVDELEGLLAQDRTTIAGDPGPDEDAFREGQPFFVGNGKCRIYSEQHIVPSEFVTASAQKGVMYGLNTKTWKMYTKGDNEKTTNGWFAHRKPRRPARQEVWIYETVMHIGMYCNDLRRNFVVTGAAIE